MDTMLEEQVCFHSEEAATDMKMTQQLVNKKTEAVPDEGSERVCVCARARVRVHFATNYARRPKPIDHVFLSLLHQE